MPSYRLRKVWVSAFAVRLNHFIRVGRVLRANEQMARGQSLAEIAYLLEVDESTLNRDRKWLARPSGQEVLRLFAVSRAENSKSTLRNERWR